MGLIISTIILRSSNQKSYEQNSDFVDKVLLRYLGISRYTCKLRFWSHLNLYREIRASGFGEFRNCSFFSGNCHICRSNAHTYAKVIRVCKSMYLYMYMTLVYMYDIGVLCVCQSHRGMYINVSVHVFHDDTHV